MYSTHYEVEGPADGLPMLMLHGFGCELGLMRGCMEPPIAEAGKADALLRVYVDLPGHGRSNGAPLSLASSDAMLTECLRIMDDVAPGKKFAVVGQSYGGYLALGMMASVPERLAGAALICPLAVDDLAQRRVEEGRLLSADEKFLATLTEAERKSFLQNAVRADGKTWQRFRDEEAPGFASANPEFLDAVDEHFSLTHGVRSLIDGPDFCEPCAIVCGRQDSMVGFRDQGLLLPKLPRATFAVLDVAGHNLQFEQPALFNAIIVDWLERLEH